MKYVLIFLLSFVAVADAVDDIPPISVKVAEVDPTTDKTNIAFLVRDKIRASRTFKLVADDKTARFIVHISAIEVHGREGVYAVATVWTYSPAGVPNEYYLNNVVDSVGAQRLADEADNILAVTEKVCAIIAARPTQSPAK